MILMVTIWFYGKHYYINHGVSRDKASWLLTYCLTCFEAFPVLLWVSRDMQLIPTPKVSVSLKLHDTKIVTNQAVEILQVQTMDLNFSWSFTGIHRCPLLHHSYSNLIGRRHSRDPPMVLRLWYCLNVAFSFLRQTNPPAVKTTPRLNGGHHL